MGTATLLLLLMQSALVPETGGYDFPESGATIVIFDGASDTIELT